MRLRKLSKKYKQSAEKLMRMKKEMGLDNQNEMEVE